MSTIRELVEQSVKDGDAPGYQYAVFDSQSLLAASAGFCEVPNADNPAGIPMTETSLLYLASFTKLLVSIVTLRAIEQGHIPNFSLADLDDSDKLAAIVSEFGDPQHNVNRVLEGVGTASDGKATVITKPAQRSHTLRQLLTHSSGQPYFFLDGPLLQAASALNFLELPFPAERLKFFNNLPLANEPGLRHQYGSNADWVGQFVTRGTGRNLRELLHTELFDPLGISHKELDLFFSASDRPAPTYSRQLDTDASSTWVADPNTKYHLTGTGSFEGDPPAEKAWNAGSGAFGTARAYAKVLQAAAVQNEKILSKAAWDLAARDSLPPGVNAEGFASVLPHVSLSCDTLYPLHDVKDGLGFNLLQAAVARSKFANERPAGSYSWCGIGNGYWTADPAQQVGIVLIAQVLPFFDKRIVKLRDEIEKLFFHRLRAGDSLAAIFG